ncbi:MAG TPA: hypothetical protein VFE05_03205 [Longimicrobiaceae bacterium]|jgi:hypothetical protein|nr:hypothetical protein [Longimicrobiaceae bacterium]
MRRVELVRAARAVLQALRESRVHEALMEVGRGAPGEGARSALLGALREYTVRSTAFGPHERKVAQALDLAPLDDPAFWARAVGADEPAARAAAAQMAQSIRNTAAYLPKLLALLSNEALRRGAASSRGERSGDGLALLEVVVIENERQRSSPMRLITALESVWLLYDVAATMQGLPSSTLSVESCDAGSDKSFAFLGLEPVIAAVKQIVLSVWDRVVFYRGRQSDVRLEMIERSVPVLTELAKMKQTGALGPEQAELLRRGILSGVKKFLDAGCTIPEIEASSSHESRTLLAPSPRLLANPGDSPGLR